MKDINEVNERGFGEILNCINAGVYITDTDRRIMFWSKGAERITGHAAEDVVGYRCTANILRHRDKDGRVLCTTDLCPLHRSMVRATPSEKPVVVYAVSKEGQNLALSTTTAPVFDEDGNVIGGVEVFRDERESIRQMELARSVQQQLLTREVPEDERVSFAVEYAPLELIGGDFYHVRRLSEDQFAVLFADAAGHGVSAALSTAMIYSLVMECEPPPADPAELLTELNERACQRAEGLGFFTAVALTVDAERKTAAFSSAGHPPAFHQRAADGAVLLLSQSQLPLGVQSEAAYESMTVQLQSGDRLLVYSDGATDILVGGEARLGTEGLRALVAEHPPEGGHDLTQLFDALLERCATVEPDDDITFLSCLLL